jgi:hypothetical protein
MNTPSRIITGSIMTLGGAILTILGFFIIVTLFYGIPLLILGIFLLFNNKEDNIEGIKTSKGGKK